MKKILVLGATGAMGTYLVPLLVKKGHSVVGVSFDDMQSDDPRLCYIKADAKDPDFLKGLLSEGFDAVVDFMMYPTKEEFKEKAALFLPNTSHYIYLSTYRVYGESTPIREDSPRLLDLEKPEDYVSEREYSIYKAEGEEVLRASGYHNYTIVRPAITYSTCRFQLTILEANAFLGRLLAGKQVILPEGAMEKEATMSWAGDVAKMFAAVLFDPRAMGEAYTFSTAEHHTWREVGEMYRRILGGREFVTVPNEDFIALLGGSVYTKQQLLYDRCFDRIVDNSKILTLAGLKQEDLMPLEEGLRYELSHLTEERMQKIGTRPDLDAAMDAYLEAHA